MPEEFNWFDHQHPEYARRLPRWTLTDHVVSCEYAEEPLCGRYLHQRSMGEPDEMYADRKKNAKVISALGKALLSITGQLFAADWDMQIDYGETLGSETDPQSRANQLANDIDGAGTNLDVWLRSFVFDLLKYQEWLYVLVEGPSVENGPVRWKIITPETVTDWDELRERPRWMKLVHASTRRAGPMDEPKTVRLYSLYHASGVDRWEQEDGSEEAPRRYTSAHLDYGGIPGERIYSETRGGAGPPEATEGFTDEEGFMVDVAYPYEYYTDAGRSERRLPIVRASLPFRYYLAYQAARNVVGLFNMTSERRNVTRMAATPTNYVTANDPDATAKKIRELREQGHAWIFLPENSKIGAITPALEIVDSTTAIIKDDRDDIFNSLLQEYNSEAAQATATKIRQDARSGPEALLDLLARTVVEVVQTCLFLTEQVESERPADWGQAKVSSKGSFKPSEPEAKADREKARYHGEDPLPLTEDTYVAHVKRQHAADGLVSTMDEEEMAAYEDELRRERREQQMDKRAARYRDLVDGGLSSDQAARVAGFSEEMLEMMKQTDTVPANGRVQ